MEKLPVAVRVRSLIIAAESHERVYLCPFAYAGQPNTRLEASTRRWFYEWIEVLVCHRKMLFREVKRDVDRAGWGAMSWCCLWTIVCVNDGLTLNELAAVVTAPKSSIAKWCGMIQNCTFYASPCCSTLSAKLTNCISLIHTHTHTQTNTLSLTLGLTHM